jgi:hypothetical protein
MSIRVSDFLKEEYSQMRRGAEIVKDVTAPRQWVTKDTVKLVWWSDIVINQARRMRMKAYMKKYYTERKDKIKERAKAYREANPEKVKKMTITILPEHQQKAKEISKELLGKENISGLFTLWISEHIKKKMKK